MDIPKSLKMKRRANPLALLLPSRLLIWHIAVLASDGLALKNNYINPTREIT